jgi:SPP1 gp7 family putative phage head morphogenesis protein
MTNAEYWEKRAISRLKKSEVLGNEAILQVRKIYQQALRNVNEMINSLYVNYANKVGIDVMELTRVLSGADRNGFITSIQRNMQKLGFVMEDIYKPEYIARLTRLEAFKQQIYWELASIVPNEVDITGKTYKEIINTTYNSAVLDLGDYLKVPNSTFSRLDTEMVDSMLRERWQGGYFKKSVWKNVIGSDLRKGLAVRLPQVLGGGLAMGQSSEKMARILRDEFKVSMRNAMRLIRTETNHFNNQAELRAYEDFGVERYQFMTALFAVCPICQGLDNQVFEVSEEKEGENYPPIHPNCKCTTIALLKGEEKYERQRLTGAEILKDRLLKENEDDTELKVITNGVNRVAGDNKPYHTRKGLMETEADLDRYAKEYREMKEKENRDIPIRFS